MGKTIDVIKVIIAINVVLALVTFQVPGWEDPMFETLALYFPKNEHFRYWQLVTNMFMHGGLMHIVFNMYALWAFGSPLLAQWGGKRFVLFYFLSGIGAGVIYLLINYFQFNALYNELVAAGISADDLQTLLKTGKYIPSAFSDVSKEKMETFYHLFAIPAVGASGAIYGVLVAFGMTYPNAKLALIFFPVPIAAKYFIPILIGMDLFSGVTGVSIFGGGIAHFAHIGGAIIGFLLMWYWRGPREKSNVTILE
ncbi:rhomboid family intramembrane serine protease [Chryseolinea lacunae]|uniref:Rhomboid family intramembrane serine protease n=1 Tax=Chryseolinea lacunae TaxID=2801331 RepID=A0ABS1KTG9_9BACT|nr:rhomboid family intramembrane serine protease [Chryseolinea lacunae]MBL0741997.1 rhomboid family intramembrane serine protease [Chryseolinea lacunae]